MAIKEISEREAKKYPEILTIYSIYVNKKMYTIDSINILPVATED